MFNITYHKLEKFDNPHDFERMAADILNALGYSAVAPISPGGGSDGGQDTKFKDGEVSGIAFVTLEKNIKTKFKEDLAKQSNGNDIIALFCNVSIPYATRLIFTRDALSKGYTLEVFDLERIRSLLDSRLKDIRRKYLHIDDEVATKLKSEVNTLLQFPLIEQNTIKPTTIFEKLLKEKLPRMLFELLIKYSQNDIKETTDIGEILHDYRTTYYAFIEKASFIESNLLSRISKMVQVDFRDAWHIYLQYAIMRFCGIPEIKIRSSGNFLNFDITWDDAENIFLQLQDNPSVSSIVAALFSNYSLLTEKLESIKEKLKNKLLYVTIG